jgi:hypothetical protein
MEFTKTCDVCSKTKKCVLNNKESEFHQLTKGGSFRNVCKVCYNANQNENNRKKREIRLATAKTGCPTADTIVLQLIKKLEDNIGMESAEYKKIMDEILEYNEQIIEENKLTGGQSMHFSKQDVGFTTRPKGDVIYHSELRNMVALTYSGIRKCNDGIININSSMIHVFDRMDMIKIIISNNDFELTNEMRLSIKNTIKNKG